MSNDAHLETVTAGGARAGGRPSAQEIEAWLTEKVTELLGIDAGEIDPEQELSTYGLSSVTGVMLTGEIEEWVGLRLEPTIAWEYPTVRKMARFIEGQIQEEVGT